MNIRMRHIVMMSTLIHSHLWCIVPDVIGDRLGLIFMCETAAIVCVQGLTRVSIITDIRTTCHCSLWLLVISFVCVSVSVCVDICLYLLVCQYDLMFWFVCVYVYVCLCVCVFKFILYICFISLHIHVGTVCVCVCVCVCIINCDLTCRFSLALMSVF